LKFRFKVSSSQGYVGYEAKPSRARFEEVICLLLLSRDDQ